MGTGFLPCRWQSLGVVQPIRHFYFCNKLIIIEPFSIVIFPYYNYPVVFFFFKVKWMSIVKITKTRMSNKYDNHNRILVELFQVTATG